MKRNFKFTPTPQLVVRKIIGTITLILLITLTPSTHPIWFGLEGILLLGLLWWRRVPPRCVLRRLLIQNYVYLIQENFRWVRGMLTPPASPPKIQPIT